MMLTSSALRCAIARNTLAQATRFASAQAAAAQGHRFRIRDWSTEVEKSRIESGEWVRDSYGQSETMEEHRGLEVTILKRAFEEFDLDKNGVLDRQEIEAALQMLEVDASKATIDKIFGDYDENNDGVISLDEWLHHESEDLRSRIYLAFKDKCEN